MNPKTYIGIDPGMTGAIGVIWPSGRAIVYDLSSSHADTVATLCEIAGDLEERGHCVVTVERVHSMPHQGVASTFKFGYGAGVLEGALLAFQFPHQFVGPGEWKRGLEKGKDASRDAARRLFPDLSHELRLVKHHGRAEALLLADWGRKHDK